MKSSILLAIAALHSLASAKHVRHERRELHELHWNKRQVLDAGAVLPVRIALVQSNLHKGHDMLMDVSDPLSPNYGKYYSEEDIIDLFAPHQDSVSAVRAWLESEGIASERVSLSANKQWLQFDSPAAEMEDLFRTKFHLYEHALSGKSSVGCDEYHVHEDVAQHIDYITPGVKLVNVNKRDLPSTGKSPFGPITKQPLPVPLPKILVAQKQKSTSTSYCSQVITPDCIQAMYNISTATTAQPGNELGIFEDVQQFLDTVDMDLFFQNIAPRIPNGTFPTVKGIDGAQNVNKVKSAGTEACLDFQISYPLIYPQQTVLFLTDDNYYQANYGFSGLFNNFLDAIDGSYCKVPGNTTIDPQYPDPNTGGYKGKLQCGVYKPTNVISLSYELAEFDTGTPAAYQVRQCNECKQPPAN